MTFATISESGQITLPIEIQKVLKLKTGDKVKFYVNDKNEVVICKSQLSAIHTAQKAFEGTAEELGLSSEDDVQSLVDEFRISSGDMQHDRKTTTQLPEVVDKFDKCILDELLKQGLEGEALISAFEERKAQIPIAIEIIKGKSKKVAQGKTDYYSCDDVFSDN